MDPQFHSSWPSHTTINNQSLSGFSLSFSSSPFNLSFHFSRSNHGNNLRLSSSFPPIKVFPASFHPHLPTCFSGNPSLYKLLRSSSRFLRKRWPQIDIPKSVLLEHLIHDSNQSHLSLPSTLAGLQTDRRTIVILSAGGSLGNEIYCSLLRLEHSADSPDLLPQFCATSKPAYLSSTPLLQLSSASSLSLSGDASFLARSYDSTTLLTHPSSQIHNLYSPDQPLHTLSLAHRIPTSATAHTAHIDACVGHTIEDVPQLVILDQRGVLWKAPGPTYPPSPVGRVPDSEIKTHTWGRCGIYPSNDCLVVGLRHSVGLIDHRLSGGWNALYSVADGHPITDVQRHISHQTPHLRTLLTTASLLVLDDRQPGVPLLSVAHMRASDTALAMAFPALPGWYPEQGGAPATPTGRFDELVLWSPKNNVASLHHFQPRHPAVPGVHGYPLGLPVVATVPTNPRTGLLYIPRLAAEGDSTQLSVVEMTQDGALWHSQLLLADKPVESSHVSCSDHLRYIWDAGLWEIELRDKFTVKDESCLSRVRRVVERREKVLDLERICKDFKEEYLKDPIEENDAAQVLLLPCSHFLAPLKFCVQSDACDGRQTCVSPEAEAGETVVSAEGVLKALSQVYGEYQMEEEDSGREREVGRRVEEIVMTATRSSMATRLKKPSLSNLELTEGENGGVRKLMAEWRIGERTDLYKWPDLCGGSRSGDGSGWESVGYESGGSSCWASSPPRAVVVSRATSSGVEEEEDMSRAVNWVKKTPKKLARGVMGLDKLGMMSGSSFMGEKSGGGSVSGLEFGWESQPLPVLEGDGDGEVEGESGGLLAQSQIVGGVGRSGSGSARKKKRVGGF